MKAFKRYFLFALIIFISSASYALTCSDLVGSVPSLSLMKQTVLKVQQHPQIQNMTLRVDSRGTEVEFMYPLVHQILSKAEAEIKQTQSEGSVKYNYFFAYKKQKLDRMRSGELSYAEIHFIPFELSPLFKQGADPYLYNGSKLINQKRMERLIRLVQVGIYPLPMFFTPGFLLRSQLLGQLTPCVSVVKQAFKSYLDDKFFDSTQSPPHDEIHASDFLSKVIESSQQFTRGLDASDPRRLNILRARTRQLGKVQVDLINTALKMPPGQREIAIFFIHQLFPEGGLNIKGGTSLADSIKSSFKSKYSTNALKIKQDKTVNKNAFDDDGFKAFMSHIGLYNVEITAWNGRFKIYYSAERPEEQFLAADRKRLYDYMMSLESEILSAFEHVVEANAIELNRPLP